MHALQVQNAAKKFRQNRETILALDNVSFSIEAGEIFGLLGPNGAGKTTLISAICGLLELDSGKVLVFGKNALTEHDQAISNTNLVTGFAGVLRGLSVEDLLTYYAYLHAIPDKKQKIDEVLSQTGLTEKRKQFAFTLSSGFRQRFYIAKALLSAPKLLLMDEPTVGLDVHSSRTIRKLVLKLKKQGMTILLTTHYMQEAEQLCDRIAFINHGKITALGTLSQLRQKAEIPKGSLEDVFVKLTRENWEGDEDK
ncbi:MAG: ABC transporter ATP-binding protein [Candidatus Micrarchaeota archaeon]